jgi:hypothetical protein
MLTCWRSSSNANKLRHNVDRLEGAPTFRPSPGDRNGGVPLDSEVSDFCVHESLEGVALVKGPTRKPERPRCRSAPVLEPLVKENEEMP